MDHGEANDGVGASCVASEFADFVSVEFCREAFVLESGRRRGQKDQSQEDISHASEDCEWRATPHVGEGGFWS